MDATRLHSFLSDSAKKATRSEIRELLKLIAKPEIISLAGGLPSPDAFPIHELATLLPEALEREGAQALQYGMTEGDVELRQRLRDLLVEQEGQAFAGLTLEQIMVTSASQQGLDLTSRVFLSPGDVVVCGLPSYLGALGAFTACGARLSGIPLDDEGMRTDLLEERLVDLRRQGIRPKLLYTVPDFQNPSGVTATLARRREMLALASEFDLLVLEDSPYRQLRYMGERQPTLWELDREGRVIALFTFSKILFPGLRLGWVVADPEIVSRLTVAKQPVDLCTSGLSQLVARTFLASGKLPAHIERVRALYAAKREAMLAALEREIDPAWGVSWTRPEGGMFVWVRLPESVDASELLKHAIEEHVAFVSGQAFHCDGSGRNTLRLNFSYPSLAQIDEGVARLGRSLRRHVADRLPAPEVEASPEPAPPLVVSGDHALVHLSLNLALCEVLE